LKLDYCYSWTLSIQDSRDQLLVRDSAPRESNSLADDTTIEIESRIPLITKTKISFSFVKEQPGKIWLDGSNVTFP